MRSPFCGIREDTRENVAHGLCLRVQAEFRHVDVGGSNLPGGRMGAWRCREWKAQEKQGIVGIVECRTGIRASSKEGMVEVTRKDEIAWERVGGWAKEGQGQDFRPTPLRDVEKEEPEGAGVVSEESTEEGGAGREWVGRRGDWPVTSVQ